MPNGRQGSPSELERRFGDMSHDERGRLSRQVLQVIPWHERKKLHEWARGKFEKSVPQDLFELLVFYALAFVTKVGEKVHDIVASIREKKSIVGIVIPA